MTGQVAFYIFLAIGTICFWFGADGIFLSDSNKAWLAKKRNQRAILAGVTLATLLMGAGIYHGHHMTVLFMFLMPTALGVATLRLAMKLPR